MVKRTKNDEQLFTEVVSFKVTKEQKRILQEAADNQKRTLSNYVKILLELL